MGETRKRYTLPRWTRAHYIESYGSLGHMTLWATVCERTYNLPDPEVDEPIEAPVEMPLCKQCADALPPSSSVDEGNTR
jgi:hypothetical protein